jgi:hypothetical protein
MEHHASSWQCQVASSSGRVQIAKCQAGTAVQCSGAGLYDDTLVCCMPVQPALYDDERIRKCQLHGVTTMDAIAQTGEDGSVSLIDVLGVPGVGANVLSHLWMDSTRALRLTCSAICAVVKNSLHDVGVNIAGSWV